MVQAIVNTGLQRVYQAFTESPPYAVAFLNTSSNWQTVILGGSIMAALSIADSSIAPAWVTSYLLPACIENIKAYSGQGWGADGSWPEGPNYGGYTARYLAPTAASFLSATGSHRGLLDASNANASARFLLGSVTPNKQLYYWFDSRPVPETLTQYLFFCGIASDASAAAGIRKLARDVAWYITANDTETDAMNAPVALLYFTPLGNESDYHSLPLAQYWPNVETVAMRTAWDTPQYGTDAATFIGFKGFRVRDGVWAHSHLDGGSFVYQSQGQWFAQDLGSDQYNAPGYFSPDRYKLYRTGTAGHNTLSFGGQNQFCKPLATYTCNCSTAPVSLYRDLLSLGAVEDRPAAAASSPFNVSLYAIVDLTGVYSYGGYGLGSMRRGFVIGSLLPPLALPGGLPVSAAGTGTAAFDTIITVDEIDLLPGQNTTVLPDLWWSLHTVAISVCTSCSTRVQAQVLPSQSQE